MLGLALAGALFGAGGLFPAFEGVAGTALSVAGFVVVGYAFLLFWVVMLHLIAKIFEGEASIAEELSAMTYAALALWLLVPIGTGVDGSSSGRRSAAGDGSGRDR